MKHLKALFEQHLGNDVILFTTDGYNDKMLECGSLPDLYTTVDFGIGKFHYVHHCSCVKSNNIAVETKFHKASIFLCFIKISVIIILYKRSLLLIG